MNGIGLAVARSRMEDRFVLSLVHALADPLVEEGLSLMTAVVDDSVAEEAVYRHWADVGGICGVALLGVEQDDPRVPLLASLGFPVAGVVDSAVETAVPAVVVDFDASIDVLRAFLDTRPQRRIVFISATLEGETADGRAAAMESAELGGAFRVMRTEHSTAAAVAAGAADLADGPVTLVFDSDVLAAAALESYTAQGLRVPEDVAIVSWTDSALCRSASRSLTAIDRRGSEIGALLGTRMLAAVAGDRTTRVRAPRPFVVAGETA